MATHLIDSRPRKITSSTRMLGTALAIGTLVGSAVVSAAPTLKTFTAGDHVRAAEINSNFDALNDAIDTVRADTQQRVTGSCQDGTSVRAINADGSVACTTPSDALQLINIAMAEPGAVLNTGYRVIAGDDDCPSMGMGSFQRCTCGVGEIAVAGGGFIALYSGALRSSNPIEGLTSWDVGCVNFSGAPVKCGSVFAVCMRVMESSE